MVGRLLRVDVKAIEKCWQQIQTFLNQTRLDERYVGKALNHNLRSPLVYLPLVVCKVNQSVGQGCSDYLCTASEA